MSTKYSKRSFPFNGKGDSARRNIQQLESDLALIMPTLAEAMAGISDQLHLTWLMKRSADTIVLHLHETMEDLRRNSPSTLPARAQVDKPRGIPDIRDKDDFAVQIDCWSDPVPDRVSPSYQAEPRCPVDAVRNHVTLAQRFTASPLKVMTGKSDYGHRVLGVPEQIATSDSGLQVTVPAPQAVEYPRTDLMVHQSANNAPLNAQNPDRKTTDRGLDVSRYLEPDMTMDPELDISRDLGMDTPRASRGTGLKLVERTVRALERDFASDFTGRFYERAVRNSGYNHRMITICAIYLLPNGASVRDIEEFVHDYITDKHKDPLARNPRIASDLNYFVDEEILIRKAGKENSDDNDDDNPRYVLSKQVPDLMRFYKNPVRFHDAGKRALFMQRYKDDKVCPPVSRKKYERRQSTIVTAKWIESHTTMKPIEWANQCHVTAVTSLPMKDVDPEEVSEMQRLLSEIERFV